MEKWSIRDGNQQAGHRMAALLGLGEPLPSALSGALSHGRPHRRAAGRRQGSPEGSSGAPKRSTRRQHDPTAGQGMGRWVRGKVELSEAILHLAPNQILTLPIWSRSPTSHSSWKGLSTFFKVQGYCDQEGIKSSSEDGICQTRPLHLGQPLRSSKALSLDTSGNPISTAVTPIMRSKGSAWSHSIDPANIAIANV